MLAVASLSSACSTPQAPEYADGHVYERTLNSYENCMNRQYPIDRGTSCDLASGGGNMPSYDQWRDSYNDNYGPTYGFYSVSEPTVEDYLSTLSDEELMLLATELASVGTESSETE
jgi:hypothetical protein